MRVERHHPLCVVDGDGMLLSLHPRHQSLQGVGQMTLGLGEVMLLIDNGLALSPDRVQFADKLCPVGWLLHAQESVQK